MQIIPAIDLMDKKVVRLTQGNFQGKEQFAPLPSAIIRQYIKQGAKRIHLVDLDGAQNPVRNQKTYIKNLVSNFDMPIQVGGGIRDEATIQDLLSAGIDKVVLGTCAVLDKETVIDWIKKYGATRFILSFDVRLIQQTYRVAVQGWQQNTTETLFDILSIYHSFPDLTFLITDISKDGMLLGPNVGLYQAILKRFRIKIQASGGVRCLSDLIQLKDVGCDSVIVGKALLKGQLTMSEALSVG